MIEASTLRSAAVRSMLADELVASTIVPFPCPSPFGQGSRYTLLELVSPGPRACVYKARDELLSSQGFDAMVAIKITPDGSRGAADALSARRINHPGVLQILDRGVDASGSAYVVSPFMEKGTLAATQVPWPARKAAAFVAQLARGVQASHMAGVVHCDLKPSNILLDEQGGPRLTDFDLAHAPMLREDDSRRGNLAFMSPEQYAGSPNALSPTADVYALGGILYWLLTGKRPHGETIEEVAEFHEARRPLAAPVVEKTLGAICLRALERDANARYPAALSLAEDLEAWIANRPIAWARSGSARRMSLFARRHPIGLALGVCLALVLIIGAWLAYDRTAGARERELATSRLVAAKSQEKLEDLKKDLRGVIMLTANTMFAKGANSPDNLLASIYWVDWFQNHKLMDSQGAVLPAHQQIEALRKLIARQERANTLGHVEGLVTTHVYVGYLVDHGRFHEALDQIGQFEARWRGVLRDDDAVWETMGILRACAELEWKIVDRQATPADRESLSALIAASNTSHEWLGKVTRRQLTRAEEAPPALEAVELGPTPAE